MKIREIKVVGEVNDPTKVPIPGDDFELGDFRGIVNGVTSYSIYKGTERTDRLSVDFHVKEVKVVD